MDASWDDVRSALASKERDIDGDAIMMVRLLDLFKAMSPAKTNKKPGQKLATYEGCLGFHEGREYKTKRVPTTQRGSPALWLT